MLLHLDDNGILHEIHTIDMNLHPVTLTGDILALSDVRKSTILIYNWKTSARAYLEFVGNTASDVIGGCHHVVFTPSTILVCHTVCINLFRTPPILNGQTLTSIATHLLWHNRRFQRTHTGTRQPSLDPHPARGS